MTSYPAPHNLEATVLPYNVIVVFNRYYKIYNTYRWANKNNVSLIQLFDLKELNLNVR